MNVKDFDYTIIWRLDGVEIFQGGVIPDDKSDIIELRAFNESKEYRWNVYGERETPGDDGLEFIDETHKLWGEAKIPYDGKVTTLTEDRGTVVRVPFEVPIGQYVFIKVRNYLSAKDKPFEFTDWRFVKFEDGKGAQEAYG